jgi:hypothetical protein
MTKANDDKFSKQEAQRRFEAALKGAMNTPHKPLKSITPKRPKALPAKAKKKPR